MSRITIEIISEFLITLQWDHFYLKFDKINKINNYNLMFNSAPKLVILTSAFFCKHKHTHTHTHTYIYIYIYVCVCVCVCVCMRLQYNFNLPRFSWCAMNNENNGQGVYRVYHFFSCVRRSRSFLELHICYNYSKDSSFYPLLSKLLAIFNECLNVLSYQCVLKCLLLWEKCTLNFMKMF